MVDAGALAVDESIFLSFSGVRERVDEAIDRALQSGVDPNMFLATSLRYAIALHRARADIDLGGAFAEAHQNFMRATGNFKRKVETATQLRQWSLGAAERAVRALAGAIAGVRRDARLARERTLRVMLSIASAAGREA